MNAERAPKTPSCTSRRHGMFRRETLRGAKKRGPGEKVRRKPRFRLLFRCFPRCRPHAIGCLTVMTRCIKRVFVTRPSASSST